MPIITTERKLRPRSKHDFYPTEPALARAIVQNVCSVYGNRFETALDPGAGDGVFGQALHEVNYFARTRTTGVDIRDLSPPQVGYDKWIPNTDFLTWQSDQRYDLIIGNPPYGALAERFVEHGMTMLQNGGVMAFLCRLSFIASQRRAFGLFAKYPLDCMWVLSPRPSFTGDGKTDADEYAVFVWRHPRMGQRATCLRHLIWERD